MSKNEKQLPPASDPPTNDSTTDSTTELEKLKARHDAVHHMPTSPGVSSLATRGQTLEDDWIRRHEKEQADAAKARQEREKREKEKENK
ncbi:hypothetical protein KA344_01825 [bacterium]|jgi:hypothetical protein|nr:hypothetical protein [bacterium]